jgi:hypothetical protein
VARVNVAPEEFLPGHVKHCQLGDWAIFTWEKDNPQRIVRTPYKCGSWRHAGECARYDAAVSYARITEAMSSVKYTANGWVFLVLTLDRYGFYGGQPWPDVQAAFKDLSRMSRNFMSSLRRMSDRNGWRNSGSDWVAAVEQHKSGWPHLNLIVYAPELAAALVKEKMAAMALGASERDAILVQGELRHVLTAAGWGMQSTAEKARSKEALASYIVKLAGKFGEVSGELAKLTQAPTNAKGKFRRLRSGKGFLPPRRKNEAWTGTLIRREYDPLKSAFGAMPLHNIADAQHREMAAMCCRLEGDRFERLARAHGLCKTYGLGLREVGPPRIERYVKMEHGFVLIDSEGACADGNIQES